MFSQTILIGRLGKDPELNYSKSKDTTYSRVSVATNTWKKQDGEFIEQTEWHSVVCFDRNAETLCKNFTKGSVITIIGHNHTSKFTDDNGNTRYKTDVFCDKLIRGATISDYDEESEEYKAKETPANNVKKPRTQSSGNSNRSQSGYGTRQPAQRQRKPPDDEELDEDLPF